MVIQKGENLKVFNLSTELLTFKSKNTLFFTIFKRKTVDNPVDRFDYYLYKHFLRTTF